MRARGIINSICMVALSLLVAISLTGAALAGSFPGSAAQPAPRSYPVKGDWRNLSKLKPDLTIQKITITPSNPTTKGVIHISAFVLNRGPVAAGPFQAQLWIGGSSTPEVFNIKGLAPGKSYEIRWNGRLSRPLAYRVRAVADSARQVKESNEANNSLSKDFVVKEPPLVHVTSARWEAIKEGNKTKMRITVFFSAPVDRSSITDVNVFRFYSYCRRGNKVVRGHITWQSTTVMRWTSYDDTNQFLCFDPDAVFGITIDGGRAKDQYGRPLDGDNDGRPGGTYGEDFTWIG